MSGPHLNPAKHRVFAQHRGKLISRQTVPECGRPRDRRDMGTLQNDVGADYTPREIEFMLAMDRYKRDNRRPFPTWSEVLQVLDALGYRKPDLSPTPAS